MTITKEMAQQKMEEMQRQEEKLWFDHFTNEDALDLGLFCIQQAKEENIPISLEIRLNHSTVFHYRSTGTAEDNNNWLRRKANAVDMLEMSTMQLFYYLIVSEREMKANMYLDPMDYCDKGGGFPIRVKGVGMVGSLCFSALPHDQDHDFVVRALSKYLKVTL